MAAGSNSMTLLGRINYLWRLVGTAFSFLLFGLAGLVLGLLVFPFLSLIYRNKSRRQVVARRIVGEAFGLFIRVMKWMGVLNYRIHGVENIRQSGGHLVVANHPTLIDVVFLVWLFPQADCVVKEAVVRNPFMHFVASAANYISNRDTAALLDRCVDSLGSGSDLILFPEGTRTIPGQALSLKMAAAVIAVRSQAMLIPVLIDCQPPTLAKNEPWYRIPPSRPMFTLSIQAPISVHELAPNAENPRMQARELNTALKNRLQRALNHKIP